MMESFFVTLKTECLYDHTFETFDDAAREIRAYIDGYYNCDHLHSSIGSRTPKDVERSYKLEETNLWMFKPKCVHIFGNTQNPVLSLRKNQLTSRWERSLEYLSEGLSVRCHSWRLCNVTLRYSPFRIMASLVGTLRLMK